MPGNVSGAMHQLKKTDWKGKVEEIFQAID